MPTPVAKMTIAERVRLGVFTHDDVPVALAALLVKQVGSGVRFNADQFINAHYEGLRGHALDPMQLKFKNVGRLQSGLLVANAAPGMKWHSFGAVLLVSEPTAAPLPHVFRRVDFYSVAPRESADALYVGDACLRLDVAKTGDVLTADVQLVQDAATDPISNVYGTMLYVAALAISAADVVVML